MSRIGILRKAKDRKCSIRLNQPGSAECTYDMSQPYAERIDKWSTGILVERFNWRASALLNQGGTPGQIWDPIWSGHILTIDEDRVANKMKIGAVGWMKRLSKRGYREDKTWVNIDDALIIRDMLNSINGNPAGPSYEWTSGTTSYLAPDGYTVRWPANSSPNTSCWIKWGGTQPNEGQGGATAYVAAAGRNFKVIRTQEVLQSMDQLVNLENGCDLYLDPLTRQLTAHRRYRRDRTAVTVTHNWGQKNVAAFGRNIDGDREVNYMLAEGDAASVPAYAHDLDRIDEIGLLEEFVTLSGVTGGGDPGGTGPNPVLLAFAGAEIIVRSDGVITYAVTPFTYSPDGPVPEPIVDYRVGDAITARAYHEKRGNIDNQVRVFGMDFTAGDNDEEILGALQLAP